MSVMDTALQRPKRFDFLQAIRLLRSMAPDAEVQLKAEPMPEGYAHEVQSIERRGKDFKISLGLQALSGVKGVLPDYLYEALLDSLHQDDYALSEFLDIFNHRFLQLSQRALEQQNLLLQDEQEQRSGTLPNQVSQRQALSKLAALPVHGGDDAELLGYSILLGLKARSISGLRQLLEDYFELAVQVRVGDSTRHRLPTSSLTRLGGGLRANSQLGQGMLLGKVGTLHRQRLEVLIEPRSQAEFVALKDDTQLTRRLREVCHAYLRDSNDLRLYLHVRRAFISEPQLSADRRVGVRLGEANCLAPQAQPDEYRKILLV